MVYRPPWPKIARTPMTRFDIIICCRYLQKCHLRYKRLESIFTQRRTRIWWVELFFAENYILVWIPNIVTKKAFITKRPQTKQLIDFSFIWYSYHGSTSPFSSMPLLLLKAKLRLCSLYWIAFAPARKPERIRVPFTHTNCDFGAISQRSVEPSRRSKWRATYHISNRRSCYTG